MFKEKMPFNFTYNYPQVARDSGFKLRNYKDGPLDWRLIGSMEIERILKDQSFEQIDAVLSHLSEAPLGSILESNILDSGIAKYFMLSQFSVQYLIFCRKFLEETVTDLRESHGTSQMELATLKRSLSEANNEILQLHKKITQIEAIHEVIYPCHLCTKNFVSNDALNLHISRKHSGNLARPDKKFEALNSQPTCKDRDKDLTLINTIKLELEIKQLKERLNNAEREIKEKTSVETINKNGPENVAEVYESSERKSLHSIGIQSNLTEIKETDDNSIDDQSSSSQNQQQIFMLQEKLQEFEKWKEEQKQENSKLLAEITNKIQDIGTALELARNQSELQIDHEKQKASSAEDLEIMLAKKVEEIRKATAANLENVVNKMEMNYKDRLLQLEKELNKLNEQFILQKDIKSSENALKTEHLNLQADTTKCENKNLKIIQINDKTSDCKNEIIEKDPPKPKESSLSESNHTFVKYSSNANHLEKDSDICDKSLSTSNMSEDDSTDISDSLPYEEKLSNTSDDSTNNHPKKTNNLKEPSTHSQQTQVKPKIITKKEAKKLTNRHLSSLGVDVKTKTLTPLLKKRFLDDLTERRNKLKMKHSQFYATRSKIKKFVDKLCSTKMPPNAKALLKDTKHIRPKIEKQSDYDEYSSSDKEEAEFVKTSTPLNENSTTTDSGTFKQRLERILASPIRKPTTAIVHREDTVKKPLPMPRKRVMFNQPETRERNLNHSLSPTESDDIQIQHSNVVVRKKF